MSIKKNIGLVIVSVILLVFSLPSQYQVKFLCFFSIIPVYLIIKKNRNVYKISLYGGLWGFFTGLFIYYGAYEEKALIYFFAVFLLTVEFFYFCFFSKRFSIETGVFFVITFEFFRNFGPFAFPSNFGISLWNFPVFISMASIGGIYSITLLIFVVNYFLYKLIFEKELKYALYSLILITFFSIPYFFNQSDNNLSLKAGFIQGNLPEKEFENTNNDMNRYMWGIFNNINFSKKASEENFDIVIWAETVFKENFFYDKQSALFQKFSEIFNNSSIKAVIGSEYYNIEGKFNSLFLYSNIDFDRYDKIRLVPLREKKYTSGVSGKTLQTDNYYIVPFICYESIFDYSKKIEKKNSFGVVSSSDIGYKTLYFNYLHAAYTVFKAVELGRYFVRVSHTGISYIVSDKGEIFKKAPYGEVGLWGENIYLKNNRTFYNQYYKIIISFYFLCFFGSLLKIGEKIKNKIKFYYSKKK